MSRPDLLNNPHLAGKLARAQAELAQSAAGLPGSHPHPRRVMKELVDKEGSQAKVNEELYGKSPSKPKPRNKRKQSDAKRHKKRPATKHERSVHERTVDSQAGEALRTGGQDGDATSDSVLQDEERGVNAK